MVHSLAGRVVLITGASRGLGAALAVACAAEGARLVLTARTRGALEEVDDRVRAAGGEPATLVPLDLAKPESVDPLGPALLDRHGRLDGFAACAADLGTLGPAAQVDPRTFARVLAVNLHANARLIRTLDPLLRASDAGRAVVVTDRAASGGRAFWGAYGASKAALEALTLAWAAEVGRITRLRVNLADPGPLRTRLRAQAYPGEAPETVPPPEAAAARLLPLLSPAHDRGGELVSLAAPPPA
jgi:NAD(P)-dependent dehydrogenase (short-subunit alcohol dehydrogenase family)